MSPVYNAYIEQAMVLGIEVTYLLVGHTAPTRQNACELDKLYSMALSFTYKIIGHIINNQRMDIATPCDYLIETIEMLSTQWGDHRNTCFSTMLSSSAETSITSQKQCHCFTN